MNRLEFTTTKPRVLKRERRLIAIDENKKLEKKQIFVWAAVDVDTKECLI